MNQPKELEPFIQEFEQVLSRDFNNMNLEQLKQAQEDFCKVAGMRDDRETICPTDEQTKARDLMWFRITEEEHKSERVKIGDLFHSSWGYDQTNVEMFKIIKLSPSGKTCQVVQIGMKTKEGSSGFMSDSVTPDPDTVLNEGKQYRVKITRSHSWHPYKKEHLPIGEIHLRGSIPFASGDNTHLQNIYKIKKDESTGRSWYA